MWGRWSKRIRPDPPPHIIGTRPYDNPDEVCAAGDLAIVPVRPCRVVIWPPPAARTKSDFHGVAAKMMAYVFKRIEDTHTFLCMDEERRFNAVLIPKIVE